MLEALKILLVESRERLKAAFINSNDGAAYVGGHALAIDGIIRLIHDSALAATPKNKRPELAVIATGGYGRGELCPHSDIDLMFLTYNKPDANARRLIEFILYMLWDLGLTVGHASRSLRQTMSACKDDITIRTALLEARYLAGEAELSQVLGERFQQEITQDTAFAFIDAKLQERDTRHRRHAVRRYMLEPDIKDGKGGLRDLHTLFWIARYVYQAQSVEAMVKRGVLSLDEARAFSAEQRFLWSLRCYMHFRAGREDDRLTFDTQIDIAPQLGFADRKNTKSVERFMRRYFLAVTSVGNLTRIFCATIADDFLKKTRTSDAKARFSPLPPPFTLHGERIDLIDEDAFADPLNMLEIFNLAQETGYDIHPNALRTITRKLNLISPQLREHNDANAIFIKILTHKTNPERVLRLMNEVGLLGKFIPDFGRIIAMMQFNMYHSYTVDEHTITAIGILSQIENGDLKTVAPVASKAIHQIAGRKELYVALLLHDIAKGRGGDHSVLGAEIARCIAPRFGMSSEATETIAWLVRHHLLMSEVAFRYDLSDPSTIAKFAATIQSPERLNLLLVLTVADIRAVGPNVWNSWKAALMRDLYTRTMAVLHGADPAAAIQNLAHLVRESLEKNLTEHPHGKTLQDARRYIDMFYPSYWTSFDRGDYIRHAEMFDQSGEVEGEADIFLTPNAERGATEVAIIVADDGGLFARIAGGCAAAGVNIVDARITTRKDGFTLDILWIQDTARGAIIDKNDLERIKKTLGNALRGQEDIEAALDRRLRQTPTRIRQIAAPARVLVNNNASTTHTVLEINGKDAPGLLYRITRALAECEVKIQMASVSTYGDRAVDVFYIKDSFGLKIERESRIKTIHATVLKALQNSDPANRVIT